MGLSTRMKKKENLQKIAKFINQNLHNITRQNMKKYIGINVAGQCDEGFGESASRPFDRSKSNETQKIWKRGSWQKRRGIYIRGLKNPTLRNVGKYKNSFNHPRT